MLSRNTLFTSAITAVTLLLLGCQSAVPDFNGQRAFEYLTEQCEFGPRNPGSEGYENCKQYFISELEKLAEEVIRQPFEAADAQTGIEYRLTNLIGRFQPEQEYRIMLGAHWDTRPRADHDPDLARRDEPILGANDGASGIAVLLELAVIMNENPPPVGVDLVFFDGEDMGISQQPQTYALGSRAFASDLPIPKPEYAIVIDMIGDRDLSIPVERNSMLQNPKLVKELWALARELKLPAFVSRVENAVYDDHIPLWEVAGIPAVDLIDFDYPNRYQNFWHTHQDVPANCSAASLEQVGTLLVNHIYGKGK